jgi:hypothetical protein
MALTIKLPYNIEQKLKHDAQQMGLSLDVYLLQLLYKSAFSKKKREKTKTISESELLKKINLDISEKEWETYRNLIKLRQAEKLNTLQHEELILLGDKIEQANAQRMHYLVALAKLKNVSLNTLMEDLGIFPIEV